MFFKGLRLLEEDIKIIKDTATEVFGYKIKVYIFGSRTDLKRKGGDIDIFIETEEEASPKQELEFLAKLELRGIERKVDLLLKSKNIEDRPIFEEAKRTGVLI